MKCNINNMDKNSMAKAYGKDFNLCNLADYFKKECCITYANLKLSFFVSNYSFVFRA